MVSCDGNGISIFVAGLKKGVDGRSVLDQGCFKRDDIFPKEFGNGCGHIGTIFVVGVEKSGVSRDAAQIREKMMQRVVSIGSFNIEFPLNTRQGNWMADN